MSARYRKGRRVAWRPTVEICRGEDSESGAAVLLGFLADRSRDGFMRFQNRMRRYQKAASEDLVPLLDHGELAGGVLYYALDGAADLPLAFLLEAGFGDEEERRQWAAALSRAALAMRAAELPLPLLEPHHAFVSPAGHLRLPPPDDPGDVAPPEDPAGPLAARLAADAGRPLAGAWEEAQAAFDAQPEPRAQRVRPRHKRPAPDLEDPGRTTGPGPYRIPSWAKAAVIAALAIGGITLARMIGGG